jgi:hypothetical protein
MEFVDRRDHRDKRVIKDIRGQRGVPDFQDWKDKKVNPGEHVHRAFLERRGRREWLVVTVCLVSKATVAFLEKLVRRDRSVTMADLECLD